MRAAGLLACVSLVLAATVADAKLKVTTLKVTTTRDELARHDGKCSLREAIGAVNLPGIATDCGTAGRRANPIVLGPGRYRLKIPAGAGDDNSTGDLNVISGARLTIIGAGTGATVIDASGLGDRVLSIASGASVTLSQLTITGGHPPTAAGGSAGSVNVSCGAGGAGGNGNDASSAGNGGGVFNGGTLNLDAVAVTANIAGSGGAGGAGGTQDATSACGGGNGGQGAGGGGIYNQGRLIVTDSSIRANEAGTGGAGGLGGNAAATGGPGGGGGQGGSGGGIYNQGTLSVTASTISQNRAGLGGQGGTGGVVAAAGAAGSGGAGGSGGAILSASGALSATNSTFAGNFAGAGGAGGDPAGSGGGDGGPGGSGGPAGNGGAGGNGGAIGVTAGASRLLNATMAYNGIGAGGVDGSAGAGAGAGGVGGGLFVRSLAAADDMKVENTIVASSIGLGCAGNIPSAIANGGHDLTYGDRTCPGANRNPKLGKLRDNGGPTWTLALGSGSAAIDRVPRKGADCPATDQRGVGRPQGRACDIGAFESAIPVVSIISPLRSGSYARGLRITAQFRCSEGGTSSPIAACRGTVRSGHAIDTRSVGTKSFRVTATDKTGHKVTRVVHYTVWQYANPLSAVNGLFAGRIDMGVDYAGSGPILAVGKGRVTTASNTDFGPPSCWGITCWPGGGIVVYRLLDGPFAGKHVYAAENITVNVSAGQIVQPGEQIATLHPGYPNLEIGWASGVGAETLAIAAGHQCTCGDPGGWSAIEGRNFDDLLVVLGAPSGYVQASAPRQSMPPGWPTWRLSARAASAPRSRTPLSEGAVPPATSGGVKRKTR